MGSFAAFGQHASGIRRVVLVSGLAAAMLANGCSSRGLLGTVGPDAPKPVVPRSTGWTAPLPPSAQRAAGVAELPLNDSTLNDILARAQSVSGTLAQANARFAQARSVMVSSDSQSLPTLAAVAEYNRAAFTFGGPVAYRSLLSAGAQASWEIDLFGGLARARQAAAARLQAAAMRVSALRVSVAAETANAYLAYRLCELEQQAASDNLASQRRALNGVRAAVSAGIISGIELARQSSLTADAETALGVKQAQCEKMFKGLVALTDWSESELRSRLKDGSGQLPVPLVFEIDRVPARVLEQRADIAALQADVAAASADVGVAEAERYPALSLSGNLLPSRVSLNSMQTIGVTTWSIGPSVRLPLFDAGRRRASAEAARIAYEAAAVELRERVRQAVAEVEQSLVDINAMGEAVKQQQLAFDGAREQLRLTALRRAQGLSSGLDEERARQQMLQAQTQMAAQSAQYAMAWIGLYRSVGGAWSVSRAEALRKSEAAE